MLRQPIKPTRTRTQASKRLGHERLGTLVDVVEDPWAEAKQGRTRVAIKDRNLGIGNTRVEVVMVATQGVETEGAAIKVAIKAKPEHSHWPGDKSIIVSRSTNI